MRRLTFGYEHETARRDARDVQFKQLPEEADADALELETGLDFGDFLAEKDD